MREGCPQAFAAYFERGGWPETKTTEMLAAWAMSTLVVESGVESLGRQIEQTFREGYYTLRRMESVSTRHLTVRVAAERAREELATQLEAMRRDLDRQEATWEANSLSRRHG